MVMMIDGLAHLFLRPLIFLKGKHGDKTTKQKSEKKKRAGKGKTGKMSVYTSRTVCSV